VEARRGVVKRQFDGGVGAARAGAQLRGEPMVANISAQVLIDRALRNILHEGIDDTVKRPVLHPHFETEMLRQSEKLQDKIKTSAISVFNKSSVSEIGFSPLDIFYLPKSRFLQRRCAYVEHEDALKYLSLVMSVADTIERARIPRAKQIVHSYRFNKKGNNIFSDKFGFHSFREASNKKSLSKKYRYKVITDISGFYDRLNIHRLESQLLSVGCASDNVRKINDILLNWSERNSYGLPVGGNASRVLAEAALIDVDHDLVAQCIPFIRFVDDFRIFAQTIDEAVFYIQFLQDRLAQDGLALNADKTRILLTQDEPTDAGALNSAQPQIQNTAVEPFLEADDELTERDAQRRAWAVYAGKIPLSYRPASQAKKEQLSHIEIANEVARLNEEFEADLSKIKDIVRAICYQRPPHPERLLFSVLRKYIEFVPYAVDMILSEETSNLRQHKPLGEFASQWLHERSPKPDYVIVSLIRLIINIDEGRQGEILQYLSNMTRDSSSICGREILLELLPRLNRPQLLRVKKFFARATLAERRAIIKGFLENSSIAKQEKAPWLKSVRATNSDIFIDQMIGKHFGEKTNLSKKKKRKKK